MASGGRVKLGITAVTAVALLAVYGGLETAKDKSNERKITFVGLWTPSPRANHQEMHIRVWLGGSQKVDGNFSTAPFNKTYTGKPGDVAEISVMVFGDDPVTFIGCSIAQGGGVAVQQGLKDKSAGFDLRCQTTVL